MRRFANIGYLFELNKNDRRNNLTVKNTKTLKCQYLHVFLLNFDFHPFLPFELSFLQPPLFLSSWTLKQNFNITNLKILFVLSKWELKTVQLSKFNAINWDCSSFQIDVPLKIICLKWLRLLGHSSTLQWRTYSKIFLQVLLMHKMRLRLKVSNK